MDISLTHFAVPVAILLILLLAVEVGYRSGRRHMRAYPADHKIDTGSIQGAMLGLLGLLLGFSFAGASARYRERQDLIDREANDIGTAYRRAELLEQPFQDQLKAALRAYLDHRVAMSRTLTSTVTPEVAKQGDGRPRSQLGGGARWRRCQTCDHQHGGFGGQRCARRS